MSIVSQKLEEIHELMLAALRASGWDVSRGKLPWLLTRSFAIGVADNHARVESAIDEVMPDKTTGDKLERWLKIVGLTKKAATGARKASALRVFGSVGSTTAIGDNLVHSSGLRYQVTSAGTVAPSGYVDVGVAAIDVGSATRLNAKEILSFTSPPAGIEENAELQKDLDEDGEDAESEASQSSRLLLRLSDPPAGGRNSDYEQWALAVTGVSAAYVYPKRPAVGHVDLTALHSGTGAARVLSPAEIASLQAIIDELRPGSVRGFRVLSVAARSENVEVLILDDGQASHAWDWNDKTPPTVSAWNGTTRTLTLSARPVTMQAGHRLVIATTGGAGEPLTVASLSGANDAILESAPSATPVAGNIVYAGGALTDPARAAIQAYFDSLGTSNSDAKRWGTWEGTLRPSGLHKVLNLVDGIKDTQVVTPAVNVDGKDLDFPLDGEVELIVAGRIIARRLWL